ncbi:MAG: VWA domain-containing protein, partial [Candidatus Aenigmarchaeota archaeon]|nr:VWA domain-containing protein [Candidatus Aenigmarchaeota archaeon]
MDLKDRKTWPLLLVSMFMFAALANMSATASAVEYGACGPIDLTIALDDTGSMSGAIDSIKNELPDIVTAALHASGDELHVGYITFNDDVTVRSPLTDDIGAVEALIEDATASGGAGLPEASDEAKNTAVNNLIGGTR